ncbi:unnamed protein product [Linum tenue]|uniref:Uncharacterized protein n=1 Tax=Linum tenue TaxID=586396 RepID=A0AAV0QY47_9ROSI|nr:unnamed protein product [Linum tenue]
MDAAQWILRYLKNAPGQGLFLQTGSPLDIVGYCDADCGGLVVASLLDAPPPILWSPWVVYPAPGAPKNNRWLVVPSLKSNTRPWLVL